MASWTGLERSAHQAVEQLLCLRIGGEAQFRIITSHDAFTHAGLAHAIAGVVRAGKPSCAALVPFRDDSAR